MKAKQSKFSTHQTQTDIQGVISLSIFFTNVERPLGNVIAFLRVKGWLTHFQTKGIEQKL